jgi:hypothetical protein
MPDARGPGRAVLTTAALAVAAVARAQFCPDVPCVSLFPCEHLVCIDGACVDVGVDCRDADACTVDSCDNARGGCVYDPYCPDDASVCNGSSICLELPPPFGGLRCLVQALNCDDGDACTADGCVEPTGCTHVPVDCDDGDVCTTDACVAAEGCTHAAISGCCRGSDDCLTDACTVGRACIGNVCTGGAPRACDDGDVCTADACDPTSGCTATGVIGCCRADADCPADGDPCTIETCGVSRTCTTAAPAGLEAVRCLCARALPDACAGQALPRGVERRHGRACDGIARATSNARRARRLVGRASRLFARAGRAAKAPPLTAPCADALRALLADNAARAAATHDRL